MFEGDSPSVPHVLPNSRPALRKSGACRFALHYQQVHKEISLGRLESDDRFLRSKWVARIIVDLSTTLGYPQDIPWKLREQGFL